MLGLSSKADRSSISEILHAAFDETRDDVDNKTRQGQLGSRVDGAFF